MPEGIVDATQRPAAEPPGIDDPITVLHVDDEPAYGDLVARFLDDHSEDITATCETSAAAALATLDAERVDCIVSDYQMPSMDGLAFLERVRERDPAVPFVLFTGKGSEAIASEAIAAGVTDYIQKRGGSGQFELLANRIQNAVRAARTRRRFADRDRLFHGVFERSFDAMVIVDDDGEYVDVNPAACELFGLPEDELLGRSVDEFTATGYDFPAAWAQFEDVDRDRGLFLLVRDDGERVAVEFAATRDVTPGRHLSILRRVAGFDPGVDHQAGATDDATDADRD